MTRFVVDASVLLRSVFHDEEGHEQAQALMKDQALGAVELLAPSLLPYELANGVLQALRGKRPKRRLSEEDARQILAHFQGLGIQTESVGLDLLLKMAQAHHLTAYDAAYLALAASEKVPLITGDKRLYNTVRIKLPWVRWVEDYKPIAQ